MLRLTSSAWLRSLFSGLTHLKTSENQGWKPRSAPPGRACLLLTLPYAHPSTWPPYYNCCLFSCLPNATESPEDKELSGSMWVCLGFHCRAWSRGGRKVITGQIYTAAMAEE